MTPLLFNHRSWTVLKTFSLFVAFLVFTTVGMQGVAEEETIEIRDFSKMERTRVEGLITLRNIKKEMSEAQQTAIRNRMKHYIDVETRQWASKWNGKPIKFWDQCVAECDRNFEAYQAELDAIFAWPNGKDPNAKPTEIKAKPSFSEETKKKLTGNFGNKEKTARVEQAIFDARTQLENILEAFRRAKQEPKWEKILSEMLKIWYKTDADVVRNAIEKRCERRLAYIEKVIDAPEKYLRDIRKNGDEIAEFYKRRYSETVKEELAKKGKNITQEDREIYENQLRPALAVVVSEDPQQRIFIADDFWNKSLTSERLAGIIVHEAGHFNMTTERGDGDRQRDRVQKVNENIFWINYGKIEGEGVYSRGDCLKLPAEKALTHADTYSFFVEDLSKAYEENF